MTSVPLTDVEIASALNDLPGWERDGDALTRTVTFDAYLAGAAFASAVGVLAEGLGHHPDLYIGYKKVTVRFNTHDAGGKITAKDVAAARAVNALGYPKQIQN
ncbi:MAG: 4a-hydroxytetrahydrobiopterin dehydratase [Chloroflexota bacterium]|jgi:4a-hydroxytetrahydrobiopterin dehydratase|nr:MAG: 4a-hydroxytetrahydrobiopterin dehydratase [Chloroflexota bacterium]